MDTNPEIDDRELLRRIAHGPLETARDALGELYVRHAGAVAQFVASSLPGDPEVDDVVQDVFLKVARHAGTFRHGGARPWLLTIAARRIRDILRSRRRRTRREERAAYRRREPADSPPGVVGPAGDEELSAGLARLPARWRAAVQLRFIQELGHAEVARVLGISLRTAKEWSRLGLEQLRRDLGGLREER